MPREIPLRVTLRVEGAKWPYHQLNIDPVLGLIAFSVAEDPEAVPIELGEALLVEGQEVELRPFRRQAGVGCDDDLDVVPAGFSPPKAEAKNWGMLNL